MTDAARTLDPKALAELLPWFGQDGVIGPAWPVDQAWSFRHMPRERALSVWVELTDWVEWLVDRYQLGMVIKGCWYRHDPVVEELFALMVAHKAAYRAGSPTDDFRDALTAFHTQWFWPVLRRIREETWMQSCTRDKCTDTYTAPRPLYRDNFGGIEDWIAADVADRPDAVLDESGTAGPSELPVTTMSVEAMVTARNAQLAQPTDPDDVDNALSYGGAIWDYDETADLYRRRRSPG